MESYRALSEGIVKEYSPSLYTFPSEPTAGPTRTWTSWPGRGYAGYCPPPGGPPGLCVYRMSPLTVSMAASRRARSAAAAVGVALVADPSATAAITATAATVAAAPRTRAARRACGRGTRGGRRHERAGRRG